MICCPGQGRRHEFRRFGAYYRQIIGKERGNHAGYGPCENVYPVRIVSGGVPGRVHPGARGARPGHQRPSAGGMPSGGPGGGGQLPGGGHRGALKAAACGASPGRICPVGAGDSAGPFLLPVPGGQSRPPLRNCWGILCGASGTPPPTECAAGGVGAKKPDAFASGFLIHSLLRIRLFGSLPSLTCPWGRRSGGRSCCRTRCRRRSRSWRRRISPQARPPGRSLSSWRPPDGRSSPWRR